MNNLDNFRMYPNDNRVVVSCPFCKNFNLMGNMFLSVKQLETYQNHYKTCRSEAIKQSIHKTIEDYGDLLEKLADE